MSLADIRRAAGAEIRRGAGRPVSSLPLEDVGIATTDNKGNRRNKEIRVPRVRVIGADAEQLGMLRVMKLAMAHEAGMDLVEIQPNGDPPVCRIMDRPVPDRAAVQRPRSLPGSARRRVARACVLPDRRSRRPRPARVGADRADRGGRPQREPRRRGRRPAPARETHAGQRHRGARDRGAVAGAAVRGRRRRGATTARRSNAWTASGSASSSPRALRLYYGG